MSEELRTSPLDAAHRALGARMVPFGGWDMPIQYAGVIEEHRACREAAVVFDVSHLGSVRVEGSGAFDALQWAFTNDLRRIEPGRAQYTHLLDETDAHVVDDIIVWWLSADEFIVMPNASNTAPLIRALEEAAARVGDGACRVEVAAIGAPHGRAHRYSLRLIAARWSAGSSAASCSRYFRSSIASLNAALMSALSVDASSTNMATGSMREL